MLCAEEGDGAEARGGRTPQPGSAHSSAGVLLPHSSWLKRFHAPPPPYPRNRCIHPSPPPPLCPLQLRFPTWCLQGGRGHTAAPRALLDCSPTDFQPHGCPPPQLMLCLQPPAAPLSLLCLFCPMLGSGCPWGGGPGLASLSPLTLKAELGTGGQGGLQRRGEGQAGGLAMPWGGGGGPRVPPLPHCCSSAATRDRGSVLFCTSWPSPLYSAPPPPRFIVGCCRWER